jgi:cytochrome c biogenesis protein CcmG, thiol:disulfide interchange protein DsbE
MAVLVGRGWSQVRSWGSTAVGVGQPFQVIAAPELNLPLYGGGVFRLADQRGKVVVVNFWASWCVPCRAEAPRLATASRTFQDRGVVFVGVDVEDNIPDAQAFVKEFGLAYPNGPDNNLNVTQAYRVTGLPATIVIDRDGRIQQRWQGEIQSEQLTRFIEGTLGGAALASEQLARRVGRMRYAHW